MSYDKQYYRNVAGRHLSHGEYQRIDRAARDSAGSNHTRDHYQAFHSEAARSLSREKHREIDREARDY